MSVATIEFITWVGLGMAGVSVGYLAVLLLVTGAVVLYRIADYHDEG